MLFLRTVSLLFLLTSATYGQSGILIGHVLDNRHTPIGTVKVSAQTTGAAITTTETDASGAYQMTLPAGAYTVRVQLEGRQQILAEHANIEANKSTTLDLVLHPGLNAELEFFDQPDFQVAGVTDNTYRGGHGSDTALRSQENLAKATAELGALPPDNHPLETVRRLQQAAAAHPDEQTLFAWGAELLTHGAANPALEVFSRGLQLAPGSTRMQLGLASAAYATGAYQLARDCFFKAVDVNPTDPQPFVFLTQVHSPEILQSPGYLQRVARFATLRPDNALAHYYLAVATWDRRRGPDDTAAFRTALDALNKSISLDDRFGPAYLQLGIVYAALQRYANAIPAYLKAIQINPDLIEAHYRLAEAYRLSGKSNQAKQQLFEYSELSRQAAEKIERERRQSQQFVISLQPEK